LFLSFSCFYLLFSAFLAAFAALFAAFLYCFSCFLDLKEDEVVLKTFLIPLVFKGMEAL
jgi:hypothetical protein